MRRSKGDSSWLYLLCVHTMLEQLGVEPSHITNRDLSRYRAVHFGETIFSFEDI
jgi:hypothetical protein